MGATRPTIGSLSVVKIKKNKIKNKQSNATTKQQQTGLQGQIILKREKNMKYDYSKSLFKNVQNIYKILTKVKLEQDELINNKEEVSLLKSKISELEKGLNELKFLNK